jgi:hypothetical protein
MAADYDARAETAAELAGPDPEEAESAPVEAAPEKTAPATFDGQSAAGAKKNLLAQRRPVGRPRRE